LWFEEAGFQAHGLKKQVLRPVKNSLQVREVVGKVISHGGPNCSYNDQRIIVRPVAEALEGKWVIQRIVEQRRSTLPRVG
jgi:hypothetical protein